MSMNLLKWGLQFPSYFYNLSLYYDEDTEHFKSLQFCLHASQEITWSYCEVFKKYFKTSCLCYSGNLFLAAIF